MATRDGNGSKAPVRVASYVIFEEQDNSTLKKIGEDTGRNANEAVKNFLRAKNGSKHEKPLVIIPERNLSRVMVNVETVRKVALTPA